MPSNKHNLFNHSEISREDFLQNYWHKKPLVIKQAFSSEQLNVLPNKPELLELSKDEEIQSRIVFKTNETKYDVEEGPFSEQNHKANLDGNTWNLLVSDIDKWHPESHQILKHFNFIRTWLFDDLMLSCGSLGGTVGPHLDNYDVFLLQSSGQRHWKYNSKASETTEWIEGNPIKLLKNQEFDSEIILNPGDILYIPPQFAHYGTIESDDCVTASIGLRSPSHSEILTSYSDFISQVIDEKYRFQEPSQDKNIETGEFNHKDLLEVETIIKSQFVDKLQLDIWFGKYITEYRSLFFEFNEYTEDQLSPHKEIHLNSFSKVCYQKDQKNADLFINGEHYKSSLDLARLLCNDSAISVKQFQYLANKDHIILQTLFENGSILQSD